MTVRQQSVYRMLLKEYPDDPDIMLHYSITLREAKDQLSILLKALAVSPDGAEINSAIGGLYRNAFQDHEKGTHYMTRAFELATQGRKINYARELIDYLEELGRSETADEKRRELDLFIKREMARERL